MLQSAPLPLAHRHAQQLESGLWVGAHPCLETKSRLPPLVTITRHPPQHSEVAWSCLGPHTCLDRALPNGEVSSRRRSRRPGSPSGHQASG
jgi:hypothetical protein